MAGPHVRQPAFEGGIDVLLLQGTGCRRNAPVSHPAVAGSDDAGLSTPLDVLAHEQTFPIVVSCGIQIVCRESSPPIFSALGFSGCVIGRVEPRS